MSSAAPSTDMHNKGHLTTMTLLFFFIYAGIGVNLTFLNVYYIDQGLTGTQIGLIGTAASLVAMVSASLWGYVSDRTGYAGRVMAAGAAGAAIIAMIYPLVHGFVPYLLLASGFAFFNSAFFILVDSTTLTLLGERRDEYGRIRLGGTFGYILTTAAAGFVYQRVGLEWMFPAYAVITALLLVVCLRVPRLPVRLGERPASQITQMIFRPAWLIFALCSFLIWTAASGSIAFLGVTINSMGGSDSLIGLAATTAAIAEIPFMFFSGVMMRRMGMQRMLWASMFFFTLRIGAYGFMPAPVWAVGINLINGPSYVFFWNSAVNYANQLAPDSLKATAQGLFQSTTNLASVVSALICGWMFDNLGTAGLFRVLALFCLAAFLIFGAGQLLQRKDQPAQA